mmetsp:Transcript_13825/g.43518  ORF Transcript_13825/g.43518 Transcript_13825/m.43518 type:complete len:275 (+) Transcript_13825:312-1136(+)
MRLMFEREATTHTSPLSMSMERVLASMSVESRMLMQTAALSPPLLAWMLSNSTSFKNRRSSAFWLLRLSSMVRSVDCSTMAQSSPWPSEMSMASRLDAFTYRQSSPPAPLRETGVRSSSRVACTFSMITQFSDDCRWPSMVSRRASSSAWLVTVTPDTTCGHMFGLLHVHSDTSMQDAPAPLPQKLGMATLSQTPSMTPASYACCRRRWSRRSSRAVSEYSGPLKDEEEADDEYFDVWSDLELSDECDEAPEPEVVVHVPARTWSCLWMLRLPE